MKDLAFLCNLGISNIRNENEEVKTHYRFVRRIHCAFIDYCMENEVKELLSSKEMNLPYLREVKIKLPLQGNFNKLVNYD